MGTARKGKIRVVEKGSKNTAATSQPSPHAAGAGVYSAAAAVSTLAPPPPPPTVQHRTHLCRGFPSLQAESRDFITPLPRIILSAAPQVRLSCHTFMCVEVKPDDINITIFGCESSPISRNVRSCVRASVRALDKCKVRPIKAQ